MRSNLTAVFGGGGGGALSHAIPSTSGRSRAHSQASQGWEAEPRLLGLAMATGGGVGEGLPGGGPATRRPPPAPAAPLVRLEVLPLMSVSIRSRPQASSLGLAPAQLELTEQRSNEEVDDDQPVVAVRLQVVSETVRTRGLLTRVQGGGGCGCMSLPDSPKQTSISSCASRVTLASLCSAGALLGAWMLNV